MFQHEGDLQFPSGYALLTPLGLVHLSPSAPQLQRPEPAASAVVLFSGSFIREQPRMSFAEAEAEMYLLAENARRTATTR